MDKFTKRLDSLRKKKVVIETVETPIRESIEQPLEQIKSNNLELVRNKYIVKIDNYIDQSLLFHKKPSVGLVIGTHGSHFENCTDRPKSANYIHLHLETWRRKYSQIPVLVHDDCSNDQMLHHLCKEYGCEFESNSQRFGHFIGDLSVFLGGLLWAAETNVDILVKMSRRFIPRINWVIDLQNLAIKTQGSTFSSYCTWRGYGFRTECTAIAVKRWIEHNAHLDMAAQIAYAIKTNNHDTFVEDYVHMIAHRIALYSPLEYLCWQLDKNRSKNRSGYVLWDNFMNTSRMDRSENYLWHDICSEDDYKALAKELNI